MVTDMVRLCVITRAVVLIAITASAAEGEHSRAPPPPQSRSSVSARGQLHKSTNNLKEDDEALSDAVERLSEKVFGDIGMRWGQLTGLEDEDPDAAAAAIEKDDALEDVPFWSLATSHGAFGATRADKSKSADSGPVSPSRAAITPDRVGLVNSSISGSFNTTATASAEAITAVPTTVSLAHHIPAIAGALYLMSQMAARSKNHTVARPTVATGIL